MTDDWHFTRNKELQGPVAFAKLKEMAREGWLDRDDLVWHSGLKEWTPAAQVPGLFGTSVSQMFQQAISGNGEPKPVENDPAARPPEMPVKISKRKIKLDRSRQSSMNWHDLAPRHVLAACGGFLATLGIAFTVIAQSRLALAFTLSGLCIAVVGLSVEIGQLLAQAVHNIGTALKEAADRRLRAQEIALEKRRLDLEVAQLAQQDKHLERILPADPLPASVQRQSVGIFPAGSSVQDKLSGSVVVINQPPTRLWTPPHPYSRRWVWASFISLLAVFVFLRWSKWFITGKLLESSAAFLRPAGTNAARAKKARISRGSRVIPAKEEKRAKGLEPSTSSLGSSVPVVLRAGNTAFSIADADGCTGGCTETDNRAEIIARAVELVAALNLSMTESVAVLRRLLRPVEDVAADATAERAEAALRFQATRTA